MSERPEIQYDEEIDASYIICPQCGNTVYLSGEFEYGFYFDCLQCDFKLDD